MLGFEQGDAVGVADDCGFGGGFGAGEDGVGSLVQFVEVHWAWGGARSQVGLGLGLFG